MFSTALLCCELKEPCFSCDKRKKSSEDARCKRLCCYQKKGSNKKKTTPLPLIKVVAVSVVFFVNQFGSMIIFPFLPFMIQDFFPTLHRSQIGSRAGYLGSAFYIGSFFGSVSWGWFADRFGRRTAMILGTIGTIISMALFGTAQTFVWAVLARFAWGVLNGNSGVAKTYLAEICDDTNLAKGFAALGVASGLGQFLGATVGGFLAQPADKYPLLKVPFFCTFPYLLPTLVALATAMCALVLAVVFLKETLKKKTKNELQKQSDSSGLSHNGVVAIQDTKRNNCKWKSIRNSTAKALKTFLAIVFKKVKSARKLVCDRGVFLSVASFALAGIVQVMLIELIPLLLVNSHENGGFDMDDSEIALIVTVGGISQLLFQVLAFPQLTKLLGYRLLYRVCMAATIVLATILPYSNKITGPIDTPEMSSNASLYNSTLYNSSMNASAPVNASVPFCGRVYADRKVHLDSVIRVPIVIWIVMCLQMGLQTIARVGYLTSAMIMIGNSAMPESRGIVNGVAQSLVAGGRSVGPILASTLFAWSATNGKSWPIDFHFVFEVIAIMAIGLTVMSFFLPKTIEKQKETKESS